PPKGGHSSSFVPAWLDGGRAEIQVPPKGKLVDGAEQAAALGAGGAALAGAEGRLGGEGEEGLGVGALRVGLDHGDAGLAAEGDRGLDGDLGEQLHADLLG